MSRSMLALGLLCVALVALDIKWLGDLHAIGAENPVGSQNHPDSSIAAVEVSSPAAAFGQPPNPRVSTSQVREPDDSRGRAADAEFLRMYSDPRLRSQLIAEQSLDRRERLNGVDRALRITPDRWQTMNERAADLELEVLSRQLRCRADPTCTSKAPYADIPARSEQIVQETLGAEKASEFKVHLKTLQERRAVEALQSRLGDSSLTRERADELIAALYAEDLRVRAEWNMDPLGPQGFSYPGLGRVLYPITTTSIEQRMAAANHYSERMRERAASLLNVEQRAAFDALQDQLLARLERTERRRRSGG